MATRGWDRSSPVQMIKTDGGYYVVRWINLARWFYVAPGQIPGATGTWLEATATVVSRSEALVIARRWREAAAQEAK